MQIRHSMKNISFLKIAKALNMTVEELVQTENSLNNSKSPLTKKFSLIFSNLSENDKKSVIALLNEMKSH